MHTSRTLPPFCTGAHAFYVPLLLALALLLLLPIQVQAQTKQDTLRWRAMQWAAANNAEMIDFPDSLRICTPGNMDGSGVEVKPGPNGDGNDEGGDGISITTTDVPLDLELDQGQIITWEGYADTNPATPFTVGVVELERTFNPDSRDEDPMDLGIGVLFPEMDYDSLRVIIFNDLTGDPPVDVPIDNPPPDDNDPPNPGNLPETPTVVWLDLNDVNDTVFTCDDHTMLWNEDGSFTILDPPIDLGVAPQARRMDGPNVAYQATFAEPVPLRIRGSGLDPVMGNRIAIIPINPTGRIPSRVTSAVFTPVNLHETTLMDASLYQFGAKHTAVGDLLFSVDAGALVLSDFGGDPEQGVAMTLPPRTTSLVINLSLGFTTCMCTHLDAVFEGTQPGLIDDATPFLTMSAQQQCGGDRTRLSFAGEAFMGWQDITVQFVRGSQIVREATIPNGGSVALSNLEVVAVGRATTEDQGWDGFFFDILRNGQPGTLRFIPNNADIKSLTLDGVTMQFPSATGSCEIAIEDVTMQQAAPGAPFARRIAAPDAAPVRSASAQGGLELLGNYPEPFNPSTTIQYALPQQVPVRLAVYDLTGRHVATLVDGLQPAGTHAVRFDAAHLASGVYLYRLQTPAQVVSKTMLLMK